MKNILRAGLLALGLMTACSFTTLDKVSAAEPPMEKPLTLKQIDEVNDQIHAWREIVDVDDKDFEGFANLTLLYYAKGDYSNSYKMAVKAAKLYEKYEINDQDDLVREAMVKGAASAYKLGKSKAAEKLLTQMLGYDLQGSQESKDTYNGMAYYYLAALSKDEGNYTQSHTYINTAITFCPHNYYFLDFLDGFFWLHDHWWWRHSHVHHVIYIMPHHYHHHHSRHPHRPPMHRPAPPPRYHHPGGRLAPHHHPTVHNPGHRPQGASVGSRDFRGDHKQNQNRPAAQQPQQRSEGWRSAQRPQQRSEGWRSAQRPQQRPEGWRPAQRPQQSQGQQVQRPAQRPQQRPEGWRPAQRPQKSQSQQMQRPSQRPQQRPEGWRPAQRPQQSQGQQMQRPAQRPQQRPEGWRSAQRPQPAQGQQVQRPAQRPQQSQGQQVQRPSQQSSQQASRPTYRPAPKAQQSSRSSSSQHSSRGGQHHRR